MTGLPRLLALFALMLTSYGHAGTTAVSPSTIAVIVNDSDPQSVEVAKYYQAVRKIPAENIIHTSFQHSGNSLPADKFRKVWEQVQSQVPESVQAYALTWTRPYKVECMSITSAFALGFDRDYCASGCETTKHNPYFNSPGGRPFADHGLRPTMMLAGNNVQEVKRLIVRGLISDFSRPDGRAYLVSTSDKHRNVRSVAYPHIEKALNSVIDIDVVEADYIENKTGVLFYFTGAKIVEKLASNGYLPGSVADHLTSTGGALFGDKQMSALKWLEAGASGSYGTVTEPCNFPGKFPNPAIVMLNYLNGDTLIEAYWKSVAMPGQGIFIGEPLASPYKGCRIRKTPGGVFKFENSRFPDYMRRATDRCQPSPIPLR